MNEPSENYQYGPIKLVFCKKVTVDPAQGLVPFYNFEIETTTGDVVGYINFKVGDTEHIVQCAGHIGYEIKEEHRGKKYAYFACIALKPFIKTKYEKIVLTSDPKNISSIRTIEKLGAIFVNEIIVPSHDPEYENGARKKVRFEWKL